MSNPTEETQEEATPTTGKGGRMKMVIALTVGLIAGAGAGSLVVGPLLASPGAKADEGDHAAECLPAEGAEGEGPVAVYSIENVVLNPAQSGGTRFLMASVGFGMRDSVEVEHMHARDAELRDIVIRVLGSKTVPELSDIQTRTTVIKEEMRAEVEHLVGEEALVDIYFPQFVIQ
jgi:flagellar FliL protein